jgi:itaconyl-CoA hydratase
MESERFFEDFTAGDVIKHWPGRTIRDFDDTWFTLMTMNTNPIHFDEHYASQGQPSWCSPSLSA